MLKKLLKFRQLRQFSTLVGQVKISLPDVKTFMKNNPTLSNALIYGGLYTAAEISQQRIRNYRAWSKADLISRGGAVASLDMASVQRYAIMGTGIMGPMFSKWYTWIDRTFPSKARMTVLKKTILDQFAFTPVCVAVFFIGMAALEGYRGREMFQEFQEKGAKTFLMDCCFWLPCTAVNFLFIKPWLRVTFVSVCSFVWLNILCWIKTWPRETSVSGDQTSSLTSSSSSSSSTCCATSSASVPPDAAAVTTIN